MKNLLSFVLVGASLLVASAAQAQEIRVRADIPFAFVLADKVYPAGVYAVETAMANTNALYIHSWGGANPALLLTNQHTSFEPSRQSKLVFNRVGKTYFLSQVWVAGSAVGREFPKSRGEVELARNVAKAETVAVAANISH